MTGTAARPTDAQIEAFLTKLRAFRDALPEDEQRLLNAMYHAAMGGDDTKDEDTRAYWVATSNTPPATSGVPYSFSARPWGTSYNTLYPTFW